MKYWNLWMLLGVLLLAACAPAAAPVEQADVAPTAAEVPPVVETATNPPAAATQVPTPLVEAVPTATNEASATAPTDLPTEPASSPEPAVSAVTFGRTEDGAFFHGAADAPVTLIDYSDFL